MSKLFEHPYFIEHNYFNSSKIIFRTIFLDTLV